MSPSEWAELGLNVLGPVAALVTGLVAKRPLDAVLAARKAKRELVKKARGG